MCLVLSLVSGVKSCAWFSYLVCYICRETDASYSSIQPPQTENTETPNGSTRLLGKEDNGWVDGAVATISAKKDQDAERYALPLPRKKTRLSKLGFGESTWK